VGAHGFGGCLLAAQGGDVHRPAGSIVFEAVKGALDVTVDHLALAQLDAAVGAFVAQAAHAAGVVAPENQLFAHARHTDGPVFHLFRFHEHIPLIGDHRFSSLR